MNQFNYRLYCLINKICVVIIILSHHSFLSYMKAETLTKKIFGCLMIDLDTFNVQIYNL
jgi:hypothetical protein